MSCLNLNNNLGFLGKLLVSALGVLSLSACSLAKLPKGMSAAEKQAVADLATSKYTPRTAEERAAIETQDLFTQTAFWSKEYDLNPADLEAAINLASTLRRMGNPKKSIEVAHTTRALYPRDVNLIAELAASYIADNNAKQALPLIDKALQTQPDMARLWSLRGAALDQHEQFELARQSYAKALALSPNNAGVIANVGLSYALSGDPKTAEIWLRRAASLPDASPSVRQNLALVLSLQNKFNEAEKWASRDLDKNSAQNNINYIKNMRGSSQAGSQANLQAGSHVNSRARGQITRQVRPVPQAINPQAASHKSINSRPETRLKIATSANNTSAIKSSRDALLAASKVKNPQNQQIQNQNIDSANILQRLGQKNTPKSVIAAQQQNLLKQRLQHRAQIMQNRQRQIPNQQQMPQMPHNGQIYMPPNQTQPQSYLPQWQQRPQYQGQYQNMNRPVPNNRRPARPRRR